MTKEALTLTCRSCGTTMTYAELNECDGCCKSCWAPVSLADYLAEAYEELGALREEVTKLRRRNKHAELALKVQTENFDTLRAEVGRLEAPSGSATVAAPAIGIMPEELRQHIWHMRREVTRQDRSPLAVRQKLAQRVTELLTADDARQRRAARHLELLEEFASQFGKPDDGEGLLEFHARTHYAQGREDGAGASMVKPEPVAWGLPDTTSDAPRPFLVLFHSTSQVNDPAGLVPLYAEPPVASHPDDCGNCFEGKSDMDHACRKCGGTGQALLVDALERIEAYAAPGYPSGQYRRMAREALADYRAQLGEEGA